MSYLIVLMSVAIGLVLYPLLRTIGIKLLTLGAEIEFSIKQHKKRKELEKQKCTGMHSWQEIMFNEEQHTYCTSCHYAPELDNFFSATGIVYLKKIEEDKKNYEKFKSARMAELAAEADISLDELNELMLQIIQIPRQYHSALISDLLPTDGQLKQ